MRLQDVRDHRNKHGLLIVTEDMNAKVGEENWDYDKVMDKHGLGQRNENENVRILRYEWASHHRNTLPTYKNINKATWVSQNRITRNQVDHVLYN